ncbi:MAG: SMR family transporter [Lachnospiraceae bacterium]|nr:SMR family transporter [Lachnospiraceae bacterium]
MHTIFLLQALNQLPAIVTYPVYNITVILIISLLGYFLFKEKLSRRKLIGLGVVILAILLLS